MSADIQPQIGTTVAKTFEQLGPLLGVIAILLLIALAVGLLVIIYFLTRILSSWSQEKLRDLGASRARRTFPLPSTSSAVPPWIVQREPSSSATKILAMLLFLAYAPNLIFVLAISHGKGLLPVNGEAADGITVFGAWLFSFAFLLHSLRMYYYLDRLEDAHSDVHWKYVRRLRTRGAVIAEQLIRLFLLLVVSSYYPVVLWAGRSMVLVSLYVLVLYFTCLLWDLTIWWFSDKKLFDTYFRLSFVNTICSILFLVGCYITLGRPVGERLIQIALYLGSLSILFSIFSNKSGVGFMSIMRDIAVHISAPYFGHGCELRELTVRQDNNTYSGVSCSEATCPMCKEKIISVQSGLSVADVSGP